MTSRRRLEPKIPVRIGGTPVDSGTRRIVSNGLPDLPELRQVPLEWIEPDPDQPRKGFDEGRLRELAEDIRRHGIDQPILVRTLRPGRFRIIAGERRYRAARIAGLPAAPILVRDDLADDEADLLRLRENLQREDLSPVETARGIRRYKELTGKTWEEVGAEFGWAKSTVLEKTRILDAPERIQEMLDAGELTKSHFNKLSALPEAEQVLLAERVVRDRLTVEGLRQAREEMDAPSDTFRTDGPHGTEEPGSQGHSDRSDGGGRGEGMHAHTPRSSDPPASPAPEPAESVLATEGAAQPNPAPGRGRHTAEIRIRLTPDQQRDLRRIAADAGTGSVAQLGRLMVDWLIRRAREGERLPWESDPADPPADQERDE